MTSLPDPAGPPTDPAGPPPANAGPRTGNDRLADGVNRCQRCGSTDIVPRPGTGMLMCLFCRYEWSEARVEERFGLGDGIGDLQGTQLASGAQDIDPQESGLMTLKCAGCGAEVVVNTATELSARCHWCRHVLGVNEQIPNGAVPDAVLPFQLTREQAVSSIRRFAGSRRLFAHKRFKAEFTPENVVGVYLPYLVVDANASSDVVGRGEVQTRRYTRGSGDSKKTYYDADVYRVQRHVEFTVDDLTVESSAARADFTSPGNTNNIINSILPFDTKNAVSWNADYLSGFTSERRDRDVDAAMPEVHDELLSIARSQASSTIGRYDRGVRWEQEGLDLHGSRWVSMYLPVWLYSYYHVEGGQGVVHYIAVNARTGETMGSVPLARGKLFLAAASVGTVVEAVVLAILAR
ncbi:TFIIB-type zinc ribbon-containing protein [uncultured Amnibacterium sp.]|uniref:TFIIB-type zinc ribbon-containing protein n=1 Tax=uncultured Amnibacterium sp. TaxID=1631851 RepID=UPI0035C9B29B